MGLQAPYHRLEGSPGPASTGLLGSGSIAQSLSDRGKLLTILCLSLLISKMGLLAPLLFMEGCCGRLKETMCISS